MSKEQLIDLISAECVKYHSLTCDVVSSALEHLHIFLINETKSILSASASRSQKNISDANSNFYQNIVEEVLHLPTDVKYFDIKNNAEVFVVEHKPQIRAMLFSEELWDWHPTNSIVEKSSRKRRTGVVSLPYLIFTLFYVNKECVNFFVHCRTKPLSSLEDELFKINLPNITKDEQLLFLNRENIENQTADAYPFKLLCVEPTDIYPVDYVRKHIDFFYNSVFTSDFTHNMELYYNLIPEFRNISTWVEHTAKDPAFIFNKRYVPHKSLESLLAEVMQNESGRIDKHTEQLQTACQKIYNSEDFESSVQFVIESLKRHREGKRIISTDDKVIDNLAMNIADKIEKLELAKKVE